MTRSLAITILLIALLATACGGTDATDGDAASTTTMTSNGRMYKGSDGVLADISDTSRIVALNGDITETVFALGAGDRVVGIDLTTTYPPEATELPDVGLHRTLTPEPVIALEPTLVIGNEQVAPDAVDLIRQAGIPVVIMRTEVTLEGVPRKIRDIGEILDLDAEAEQLVEQVEAEIGEALDLAAKATETPRAAYLYVRGPETLLLFGTGMATNFMMEAAGAVDAAAEAGVVFAEELSAERLVTAAPEVLLTPVAGFEIIGGLDAFLALPGVDGTPAGENRRVLTYDEALLLGMGPRTGEALMLLVTDLHPELTG